MCSSQKERLVIHCFKLTQRDNTTESRVQNLHLRSNFPSLMINSPTTETLATNSFTTRTGRGLV